jgi:hypothetical protein
VFTRLPEHHLALEDLEDLEGPEDMAGLRSVQ